MLTAHRELEKLVCTIHQNNFKGALESHWAYLCYAGLWLEPLRADLDAYMDSVNEFVTGEVTLKLYRGSVTPVARSSPYALYDRSLASFGESGGEFSQQASPGLHRAVHAAEPPRAQGSAEAAGKEENVTGRRADEHRLRADRARWWWSSSAAATAGSSRVAAAVGVGAAVAARSASTRPPARTTTRLGSARSSAAAPGGGGQRPRERRRQPRSRPPRRELMARSSSSVLQLVGRGRTGRRLRARR